MYAIEDMEENRCDYVIARSTVDHNVREGNCLNDQNWWLIIEQTQLKNSCISSFNYPYNEWYSLSIRIFMCSSVSIY